MPQLSLASPPGRSGTCRSCSSGPRASGSCRPRRRARDGARRPRRAPPPPGLVAAETASSSELEGERHAGCACGRRSSAAHGRGLRVVAVAGRAVRHAPRAGRGTRGSSRRPGSSGRSSCLALLHSRVAARALGLQQVRGVDEGGAHEHAAARREPAAIAASVHDVALPAGGAEHAPAPRAVRPRSPRRAAAPTARLVECREPLARLGERVRSALCSAPAAPPRAGATPRRAAPSRRAPAALGPPLVAHAGQHLDPALARREREQPAPQVLGPRPERRVGRLDRVEQRQELPPPRLVPRPRAATRLSAAGLQAARPAPRATARPRAGCRVARRGRRRGSTSSRRSSPAAGRRRLRLGGDARFEPLDLRRRARPPGPASASGRARPGAPRGPAGARAGSPAPSSAPRSAAKPSGSSSRRSLRRLTSDPVVPVAQRPSS